MPSPVLDGITIRWREKNKIGLETKLLLDLFNVQAVVQSKIDLSLQRSILVQILNIASHALNVDADTPLEFHNYIDFVPSGKLLPHVLCNLDTADRTWISVTDAANGAQQTGLKEPADRTG